MVLPEAVTIAQLELEVCQSCAISVATRIIQLCPNQKAASVCNENCSLQYSDSQFFSVADIVPRLLFINTETADDSGLFNSKLESLLGNISVNAAADPYRLAVGRTSYTSLIDIYAMAQCTRKLTVNECFRCLESIIGFISQRSSKNVGARAYALSCNIRYETYSFFSLSSLPPPPLPRTPPPPPSPATATKDSVSNDEKFVKGIGTDYVINIPVPAGKSFKTVITIVISVTVTFAVMMAIVCGCLFWKKGKTKRVGYLVHNSRPNDEQVISSGVNEEGYTTIDSLSIGLNTLREATGNFCDEYKLGQGGFGPVYKIVMMVSGYTLMPPTPSRPAFFVSSASSGSDSGTEESGSSQLLELSQRSINEISITQLDPR
ncbi:unnamed protein product [Dovyalis caffra]|uniref:Gnk2-homologous domain-containing protein n=1 Tax=Dovyalis caffra TaxID=77055 RepID=A0AAV1SNI1_9ROSI|nr:unnamed protein product [Dovyalis caffra]